MAESKFNLRAHVSVLTTFSFVVMVITGIVLYVEPHGRVAYWTDWRLLGLGKDDWDGIHIVTALLFLVAVGFHTWFNWKALVRYLKGKLQQGKRRLREVVAAIALVLLFSVGAAAGWQPFQLLLDLNEHAKASWATDSTQQPPFGHAEMGSVVSLCRKLGMDVSKAMANLIQEGIEVQDSRQTIKEIASRSGRTPREVFRIMRRDNLSGTKFGRYGDRGGRIQGGEDSRPTAAEENSSHPQDELTDEDGKVHHQREPRKRLHKNAPSRAGRMLVGRGGGRKAIGASPAARRVFEQYAGKGLGRHTIRTMCRKLGLPLKQGLEALSNSGINARADQSIKSVAIENDIRSGEVLSSMCSSGGCT